MRTAVAATVLGSFVLTGGVASADPVEVGDIVQLRLTGVDGTALTRFSDGGPFRMDLPGTGFDFLTFCLEVDESFTPGENLRIGDISDAARRGGINTNSSDPISGTTAFLYTMFRANRVSYTNGALMQEAIWFREEERTTRSAAAANLITMTQADMATTGWGLSDTGDVRVANLYRGSNYGAHAQDMLVISRVPEPATLALMGIGILIGTRGRRRRPTR